MDVSGEFFGRAQHGFRRDGDGFLYLPSSDLTMGVTAPGQGVFYAKAWRMNSERLPSTSFRTTGEVRRDSA